MNAPHSFYIKAVMSASVSVEKETDELRPHCFVEISGNCICQDSCPGPVSAFLCYARLAHAHVITCPH